MLAASLRTGLASMRRRYGALLAASLLVVAAVFMQNSFSFAIESVGAARTPEERKQEEQAMAMFDACLTGKLPPGSGTPLPNPTPEEQRAAMQRSLFMGCAGCTCLLLTVFLSFQLATSALVAGAAVAGDRSGPVPFARGFACYWQSVATWCILGAIAMALSVPMGMCIFGAMIWTRVSTGQMLDPASPTMLWLSVGANLLFAPIWIACFARILWAPIRVADPWRTALGPGGAIAASWRATRGRTKWPAMGVLALAYCVGVLAAAPGVAICMWARFESSQFLSWLGIAAIMAGMALVSGPFALAVLGAAYERLMLPSGDDLRPPGSVGPEELAALSQ